MPLRVDARGISIVPGAGGVVFVTGAAVFVANVLSMAWYNAWSDCVGCR